MPLQLFAPRAREKVQTLVDPSLERPDPETFSWVAPSMAPEHEPPLLEAVANLYERMELEKAAPDPVP